MKSFNLLFLLLIAFLATSSCSVFSEDSEVEVTTENLVFRTDQTAYTAQLVEKLQPAIYGFTLIARLENSTEQSIYLNRCETDSPHPIYGLRLMDQDESKKSGYNPVYACAEHGFPIKVESGTVRIDTLHVQGPNTWNHNTKESTGILEGTYRLSYAVQTCRSGVGCELPDSLSLSNEFEVRLEE